MRPRLKVVAYEGSSRYLGRWQPAVEQVCAELGLQFVINPRDIRAADLLVAFRDGEWDGWACRQWKSGIKYVNAIVAGRPIITQGCAAFAEIKPYGMTIGAPDELKSAIEYLGLHGCRKEAYDFGVKRVTDFRIENIAKRYLEIITSVIAERAA